MKRIKEEQRVVEQMIRSVLQSIAIFLQNSKEEKEVAEIAEQCLMRIQADGFLRNMPSDLQMP